MVQDGGLFCILPSMQSYFFMRPSFLLLQPRNLCKYIPSNSQTRQLPPMETSHQLPSESFSYSWLINPKNPSDFLGDSLRRLSGDSAFDAASFIEMDPNLLSMRFSTDAATDFAFTLPLSQLPTLVPADQIFSDGLLLPLHLTNIANPKPNSSSSSSASSLTRSLSLDSSESTRLVVSRRYFNSDAADALTPPRFHSAQATPLSSLSSVQRKSVNSRRGSKLKSLRKYLCFLVPLCKKVMCFRLAPVRSVRRVYADFVVAEMSPRSSSASAAAESIHEAVLYCKNSSVSRNK